MLTIDFDRLALAPGQRVLDLGCGAGRHAFEVSRRGADVVALDLSADDLAGVAGMLRAMDAEGEAPPEASAMAVRADALTLPFADHSFDRVIASEILEHVPEDELAIAEVGRVLKPGGILAVSVPRWLPERICWLLSTGYHEVEGGHVRIYRRTELVQRLEAAGLACVGWHHAHALHSPYWWLKCLVGHDDEEATLPRLYHRMLVWDLMQRPLLTRAAERVLDPVIGKSLVVYLHKPAVTEVTRAAA